MNINVKRALLGMIVIIICFGIIGGDGGWQFLIASIVCTVGISLFIYIPVAIGIGYVIEMICAFLGFTIFAKDPALMQKRALTPNQMALVQYVTECHKRGIASDTFYATLRASGWSDADISDAVNYVQKNNAG